MIGYLYCYNKYIKNNIINDILLCIFLYVIMYNINPGWIYLVSTQFQFQ